MSAPTTLTTGDYVRFVWGWIEVGPENLDAILAMQDGICGHIPRGAMPLIDVLKGVLPR